MKFFIAIVITWLAIGSPAMAADLIDEPQGLAWSRSEVFEASAVGINAVLERAQLSAQVGCRTHCLLIEQVWSQLAEVFAQQQQGRAHHISLSLHVVQLPEVDAFAVPDGRVVLSEAFVRARGLDAPQLAFVLAHEAAHALLEHERQTLTSALSLLPRNVPRSVADVYVEMDYNFALIKSLQLSLQQAELAADEAALKLAALAGYAPEHQLRFMQDEARRVPESTGLIATHPSAASRLQALQALLPHAQQLLTHRAAQAQ